MENKKIKSNLDDKYKFRLGWHRILLAIFPVLYGISSILLYDPTVDNQISLYIRIICILFAGSAFVLSYTNDWCKRNIEYFAYGLIYLVVPNTALSLVENPSMTMMILFGIVMMLCTYIYATKWFLRFYIFLTLVCSSFVSYNFYINQVILDPMTVKGGIVLICVQITLFIYSYAFFQEKQQTDEEWVNEIIERKKIQKDKDKLTEIYHIVTENIPVELALFRIEKISENNVDNIVYDYINNEYEPNVEKRNLLLNSNEILLMRKQKHDKNNAIEVNRILERFSKIEKSLFNNKKITYTDVKNYRNGDKKIVERNIIPIYKEDRSINYVLFTGVDITEKIRSKKNKDLKNI